MTLLFICLKADLTSGGTIQYTHFYLDYLINLCFLLLKK